METRGEHDFGPGLFLWRLVYDERSVTSVRLCPCRISNKVQAAESLDWSPRWLPRGGHRSHARRAPYVLSRGAAVRVLRGFPDAFPQELPLAWRVARWPPVLPEHCSCLARPAPR